MIVTHTAAMRSSVPSSVHYPTLTRYSSWYSSDHSCYLTTPVLSKVVCGQFNCLGAICSSVSRAGPDFPAKRTSSSRLEWCFGVSRQSLDSTRQASPGPTAETNGLDSPPTNRRVLGPNASQTPPPSQVRCSPDFPGSTATVSGSPKGGPSLTDSCSSKSGLVPLLTMRQGYHLQRPSAVVSRTTDSRPRSFDRARDRRSEPAVPLVLRRISGAKAESLIGRVKLTCLTTV